MINNNLDFEKNSNSSSATTTLDSTTARTTTNLSTPTKATPTTNDNSYFNRFDNRIAANLAAVINGTRFRSSSCSKSTTRLSATTASNNAKGTATKSSHYTGVATLYGGMQRDKQHSSGTLKSGADAGDLRSASPTTASMGRRRPAQLFAQANLNCNDNEKVMQTPSSEEDNSPTELNNCKRLADKPPLVKRLTMGLLRSNEESRPLVNYTAPTSNTSQTTTNSSTPSRASLKILSSTASNQIYSNGYINEESFEPEKYIASKFGDSCRQSLTAIPMLDTLNLNDNSEFNLKKRYLRETSSANSSPKIFSSRLRMNNTLHAAHVGGGSTSNVSSNDDEEADLKDAPWFQAGISREIALEVLANKSPGAFLVRKSTSKPGCYALTLRVPSPPGPKIANYIILKTARGYKIKGFRKEFSSLRALITHHSVMPELLPVPLAMPRPKNMTSSRRNLDDFDTYDSLQLLLKYLRAKHMENE